MIGHDTPSLVQQAANYILGWRSLSSLLGKQWWPMTVYTRCGSVFTDARMLYTGWGRGVWHKPDGRCMGVIDIHPRWCRSIMWKASRSQQFHG